MADLHGGNWTTALRTRVERDRLVPRLLADEQPVYVRSWVYLFGVATVAGLVVLVGSGLVLSAGGPSWHDTSRAGRLVDSIHWWGVQLFFGSLALHAVAQLLLATWRGGRRITWLLGGLAFVIALPTALTGYLSQQNFESQWIAAQVKDAVNAVGLAWLMDPFDVGRMLTFHVVLLPTALVCFVILHLLWVRRHGVCPPLGENGASSARGGPEHEATR
jgi:hypothetical protein